MQRKGKTESFLYRQFVIKQFSWNRSGLYVFKSIFNVIYKIKQKKRISDVMSIRTRWSKKCTFFGNKKTNNFQSKMFGQYIYTKNSHIRVSQTLNQLRSCMLCSSKCSRVYCMLVYVKKCDSKKNEVNNNIFHQLSETTRKFATRRISRNGMKLPKKLWNSCATCVSVWSKYYIDIWHKFIKVYQLTQRK